MIVRSGGPETPVRAPVEKRLELQPRDAAAVDGRPDPHRRRVPASVVVEHFLPRQRELDRAAGNHREFRRADGVGKQVELAAESAADIRHHDPEGLRGNPQDLRQQLLHVVGRLVRQLQGQPGAVPVGDIRVRLHGDVRAAGEVEYVFARVPGAFERRLRVAELERDHPVGVSLERVRFVDPRIGSKRVFDGQGNVERRVFDVDQVERPLRDCLGVGADGGDRLADVADLVHRERRFVLRYGQDAVADGEVGARDHRVYALERQRPVDGDAFDTAVGDSAPLEFCEQHARQDEVVRITRPAGYLAVRVHAAVRPPDDFKIVVFWRAQCFSRMLRGFWCSRCSGRGCRTTLP